MYKNKKDVDKHVEKLLSKLSLKEFKNRAYSVARLYFEVGDYENCKRHVEQYLTQKDNNAAAYKLLGQALLKMGQKDKALEQFVVSLNIDQTQTGTILDICELLADGDVTTELGRAKYWLEKAEAIYPRHPITFRLREKLVTISEPDPEALIKLLTMEITVRPKDPVLHAKLLKHYLKLNQVKEAFHHSCNIEFSSNNFSNNYAWYETLEELLTHDLENIDKCLYQLLLLTVKERITILSLTETPSGSSKSLSQSADLVHEYDQALLKVTKAGAASGFAEFHSSLLLHHRGQLAFHAATLLLKRAKKDTKNWSWMDATKSAAPLMLMAWQSVPLDCKVNWLRNAPEMHLNAVNRWYYEGTYRCSQSGHYLIANFQNKNQSLLDEISQSCSGSHWKDKLYEKVFIVKTQASKINSSYFTSNTFTAPQLRMPRKIEVEAYDSDAQKEYGNSLHHFVWTLLNYKNFAHFKCTLFDMLTPTVSSCGPETLNKLDIYAFLYCAALTSRQKNTNEVKYVPGEKPNIIPAHITDLLCPLPLMKWWDCAYKFSQNLLGTELTDIRSTLSRGIEVVRCIDNHGLDPELLCILGRIFSDQAKVTTSVEEKNFKEVRAGLYYSSAIPLLEKLKSKIMIHVSEKRLFDYTHKEMESKQLNALLEESKLFVAISHINDNEYEKAIELLASVKSQQAFYHLAQAYKKVALEDNYYSSTDGSKSKYETMLSKARTYAYKALNILKGNETNKNMPIYSDTQELIEEIEICMNKVDPNSSNNDIDDKYSSDEDTSYRTETKRTNSTMFRNISSTPKASSNQNNTNYRTAIDSELLETTRMNQRHFERIETEILNLQKRDNTISDFMNQTKNWFDENRNLGNKINAINSNIQNTTDQFKQLKISVDQVKNQIDECRNECKDVGELKKQVAELKKEVNKLKKSSSEQTVNESDLYNLDDYRTNETSSSYGSQLPYSPQIVPGFNQRQPLPIPPNPYQLYNQTLYNLYNQYSQFAQAVPGAPPLFDPARAQMNYPGVYPTPDQMFLDMAHLIPAAAAAAPTIPPTVPVPAPAVPAVTVASAPPISTSIFPSKQATPATVSQFKDTSRTIPANVVITSSKPLPTSAPIPAPVLSVTIPQKHIKANQPHNYQIPMPTGTEAKASDPPVFSFTMPESKNSPVSTLSNWNKAFQTFSGNDSPLSKSYTSTNNASLDVSKSVVDGSFASASPNTSLNKSRTLSEKSNTSVDNYDPCPDFKPIVPLPAEVKVTTGEEDETVIFSSRAKLYRFVDKQWKERGLGEMKLLKHKTTGKVRVLMRREKIHKICANHIITPEMEINPMKNETKAYIWVANDFAEESVVFEQFSIRFKTADIAKQFYETFEKARQESLITNTDNKPTSDKPESKVTSSNDNPVLQKAPEPAATDSSQGKTVVGGFTFNTTPIFKPVKNEKTEAINPESVSKKTNVFSNLTFKTGASTPFSNMFNTTPAPTTKASSIEPTQESDKNKLNTSDTVEEFEPTAEFKPVIALPALVDQKTGEEDEVVLFEHRAKLLRYDSTTKEWKERGLGNIKLLAHKDNQQKVRLLMRREQTKKVCCNHVLTKEMIFQKMSNVDKAVFWCAKDFSEGELVTETFCLRFKTAQICDDFMSAIQTTQSSMKDTKAIKEEQNSPNQTAKTGFGDQFKPKAGSWSCQGCYTNNLESFSKCACCDQPNPQAAANKADAPAAPPKVSTQPLNWGDKFKPKPGSWECGSCLVRNEASVENCTACNSSKDPTSKKPTTTIAPETKISFNFGIPQQTAASIQNQSKSVPPPKITPSVITGFGDIFKPKEGTWECKQCFVRNAADSENCCACQQKTTNVSDNTTAPTVKFSFGIPSTLTNIDKPKSEFIFEGTDASKFSFGIPSKTIVDEKSEKPPSTIFAAPKMPTTDAPLNFSLKFKVDNNPSFFTNPSSTETCKSDAPNSFADKNSGFGFVLKTTATKSPAKSPHKREDESEGEDVVEEDDCAAHFNPVVPLPDKVEVVTGEENEEEIYAHRARLYIFLSGEWKERGTGIVKILKHKETSKLRVVMRREQVLKICLNHALTTDIIYNLKDEKTWIFAANDFSEGELALQKFCLRFSNKEIAMSFKNAVDDATKPSIPDQKVDDDVVFVSHAQANSEDKQKAKDLMLPENFYLYKHKEPCRGCRGCSDEEAKSDKPKTITVTEVAAALAKETAEQASSVTPVKSKLPTLQSPANSIYGTPGNDKTFDTSIFRTPLGSIGSNTLTSTPTNNNDANTDATNKENLFAPKQSVFSNFGDQKSIFGTPQGQAAPVFGSSDSQTPARTKSSLLAPPKLNALNASTENQTADVKSIFTSGQALLGEPSIFGGAASISSNKSIFGFANLLYKAKDEPTTEVKSIFGGNATNVNLFSGTSQGSIFGPGSLNSNQPQSGAFGMSPLFGSNNTNENKNETSKFGNIWGPITSNQNPVTELPLKLEDNLSFASLSTSGPGFEKKADFKWAGTGQQLFNSNQEKSSMNDSGAGDDTGDADDYDPHYAPVVPLPDKIVVTTGEEDEEKLFGERSKLYRYDDKNKEWKERGVGELKVLHHPTRNTYRLLLRREQVHKAVLNMLIHPDMELHAMKNTETAWTFAGNNYAEDPQGLSEMLAVRFKTLDQTKAFRDRVMQCARIMQAEAATAIREEKEAKEKKEAPVTATAVQETEVKESKTFGSIAPLRLPKHLQDNARADMMFSAAAQHAESVKSADVLWGAAAHKTESIFAQPKPNGGSKESMPSGPQEPEEEEDVEEEEYYDEENKYEDDQDSYYHEEDALIQECEGEVTVQAGDEETSCPHATIQVFYDEEVYSNKIMITDSSTGEILVDMGVQTDTKFQVTGNTCKWTGIDFTTNASVDKTVTVNFFCKESATAFYDCVIVPGTEED